MRHGVDLGDERGPWVTTASSTRFYPFAPRAEEVSVFDIAHSLSMQARFNGHGRRFYSVAEHCVHCSCVDGMDVPTRKWLLMHDAAEAYLGDIVSPVKAALDDEIGGWLSEIEANILAVIAEAVGLPREIPAVVKEIDARMCATEKRDLLPGSEPWPNMPEPYDNKFPVMGFDPGQAKTAFMSRYQDLWNPVSMMHEPSEASPFI